MNALAMWIALGACLILAGCGGGSSIVAPTDETPRQVARVFGGSGGDHAQAVATFADGSYVVTGYVSKDAVFGRGEPGETTLPADSQGDMFLARYQADGSLAWVKGAFGDGLQRGKDVATFPDGSCVVIGGFVNTTTFGRGETGEVQLMASGGTHIFIARYAPDGLLLWVRQVHGTGGTNDGQGVAAMADGSIRITGSFTRQVVFRFGVGRTHVSLRASGSDDIFVARYEGDGSLAWARGAGSTERDSGKSVAPQSDGSCVVTGYFSGAAVFLSGSPSIPPIDLTSLGGRDVFVARYGPDGALEWARQAGGPAPFDVAFDVATHEGDAFVITGSFGMDAVFGKGESTETMLSAHGFSDMFVARYEADGRLAWVRKAGGPEQDTGKGIVALADGACLVTGHYETMAAFGGDETTAPTEALLSRDGPDVFLARYDTTGTLSWVRSDGGASDDSASGVAAFADGSMVVVGLFGQDITFGADGPNEVSLESLGPYDAFVARFGADGSF